MSRPLLLLALVGCSTTTDTPDEPVPAEAQLLVDVPARAAWVAPGPVEVRGSAQNLTNLTLDGTGVSAEEGGAFSTTLNAQRGIQTFELAATDLDGDVTFLRRSVLAGTFTSPERPVQDAARIEVAPEGIDLLLGLIDALLDIDALTSDLSAANPVVAGSALGIGYEVDLVSVDLQPPIIDVTLEEGRLLVDASVDDIAVVADLSALGITTELTADISRANASLSVALDAVGGGLDVDLSPIVLELTNFQFDVGLIPFGFEDSIPILSDEFRDFVVESIVEQVDLLVPTLVDQIVGGLDPSFETEVLGNNVAISAIFTDASIAPSGVGIAVDIDVQIDGPGPAVERPFAGTLVAPPAEHELPTDQPFRLSLHDDLLNRILFEVWQAGILDLTLSTDDDSLDASLLSQLQAEQGTIALSARLPPVATERNGELLLQLGELGVNVQTPGGGFGNTLDVTVAGSASLAPEVSEGGLRATVGAPDILLAVDGSDWGADEGTISNLLADQLPINTLLLLVSAFEFPLPDFLGLTVDQAAVGRSNAGVHTTVSFSLATVPPGE